MMRKQYHLKRINGILHAWDVDRLIELSKHLPIITVSLNDIAELDEPYWFEKPPTCREISLHVNLCNNVDIKYPIILSKSGRVLDGMHRVLKSLSQGNKEIKAVRLQKDYDPDYIGVEADKLPYEN